MKTFSKKKKKLKTDTNIDKPVKVRGDKPTDVIIGIRPVVTYHVDVHRRHHSMESSNWASVFMKGNFASLETAKEYVDHLKKQEEKNCPNVILEDRSHTLTVTKEAVIVLPISKTLERSKKMPESPPKKLVKTPTKPKQAVKPVLTINKAKDMLKARKKIRKLTSR